MSHMERNDNMRSRYKTSAVPVYQNSRKNIRKAGERSGLSEDVQTVLLNLMDYMEEKELKGACHAVTSALYVALCEMGESPDICIGECRNQVLFDHSWIVLNGKIIDMAIAMPLFDMITTGAVVADIDTAVMQKTKTAYGVSDGNGLDGLANMITIVKFTEYMDNFPYEPDGLWGVVRKILPDKYPFNKETAKLKYANVQRKICI